jgi:hypothetical protein
MSSIVRSDGSNFDPSNKSILTEVCADLQCRMYADYSGVTARYDSARNDFQNIVDHAVPRVMKSITDLYGLPEIPSAFMPSVIIGDPKTAVSLAENNKECSADYLFLASLPGRAAFKPPGCHFYGLPEGPALLFGVGAVTPTALVEECTHFVHWYYSEGKSRVSAEERALSILNSSLIKPDPNTDIVPFKDAKDTWNRSVAVMTSETPGGIIMACRGVIEPEKRLSPYSEAEEKLSRGILKEAVAYSTRINFGLSANPDEMMTPQLLSEEAVGWLSPHINSLVKTFRREGLHACLEKLAKIAERYLNVSSVDELVESHLLVSGSYLSGLSHALGYTIGHAAGERCLKKNNFEAFGKIIFTPGLSSSQLEELRHFVFPRVKSVNASLKVQSDANNTLPNSRDENISTLSEEWLKCLKEVEDLYISNTYRPENGEVLLADTKLLESFPDFSKCSLWEQRRLVKLVAVANHYGKDELAQNLYRRLIEGGANIALFSNEETNPDMALGEKIARLFPDFGEAIKILEAPGGLPRNSHIFPSNGEQSDIIHRLWYQITSSSDCKSLTDHYYARAGFSKSLYEISMLSRTRRMFGITCLAQDNPFIGFEMTLRDITAIKENLKTSKPFVPDNEYKRERRKLMREEALIYSEASRYLQKVLNDPVRFLTEAGNSRWDLKYFKKAIEAVNEYEKKLKPASRVLTAINAQPLLKLAARHILDKQIEYVRNADNEKDFENLYKGLREILAELRTELGVRPTDEQRAIIKELK